MSWSASASGDGGVPAGPSKEFPVAQAWWAGWKLLFTRLPQLFPLIVLPVVLAYALETSPWAARMAKSNQLLDIIGLQVLSVAIFSLVAVGAYAVALGKLDGRPLLHVHVGRAELSFLRAKLIFWAVFFLLYVGASITAQQLVGVLRNVDAAISTASAQASDETWARQLTILGMIGLYAPLAIAAAVFAWFAARFALVFPAAMATGRLRIFEAMALTKGRSWSLFAFLGMTGAQLLVIYALAGWYGGFGPYGLANRNAAKERPAPVSQYVFGANRAAAPKMKAASKWIEPVSLVLLGTVWQIVFAGGLAYLYREVAPAEDDGKGS